MVFCGHCSWASPNNRITPARQPASAWAVLKPLGTAGCREGAAFCREVGRLFLSSPWSLGEPELCAKLQNWDIAGGLQLNLHRRPVLSLVWKGSGLKTDQGVKRAPSVRSGSLNIWDLCKISSRQYSLEGTMLQPRVGTPCPSVCKGSVWAVRSTAPRAAFQRSPGWILVMCKAEGSLLKSLEKSSYPSYSGTTCVPFSWNVWLLWQQEWKAVSFSGKTVLWKEVWRCLSGKNSSRKKGCLISKSKVWNSSACVWGTEQIQTSPAPGHGRCTAPRPEQRRCCVSFPSNRSQQLSGYGPSVGVGLEKQIRLCPLRIQTRNWRALSWHR